METFRNYLEYSHAPSTIESYERAIDHFLFHSKKKEKSDYLDILEYLQNDTYNRPRDISALKAYFNYLIVIGKRDDHPCRSLKLGVRSKDIQFQELFTGEELNQLLEREERYEVLTIRNQAVISLLIYQGLTSSNIERLRLEDLNIDTGTIYVRASPKLTRRTLELKPKQFHLLYRYLYECRPKLKKKKQEALFLGKLGTAFKVDTLNRMLIQFQSLFPTKNLNARTIRQSVIANWLNEHKTPLEDVQLLAGHKRLSTTERYIRPDIEERRDVINEFFPI